MVATDRSPVGFSRLMGVSPGLEAPGEAGTPVAPVHPASLHPRASTAISTGGDAAPHPPFAREFRRGFVAMVPLWPGVMTFAVTFALVARTAGFSALETQALSMLVAAGSAQLAVVTLFAAGSGAVAIVLTAFILNLRHVLYGLSLNAQLGTRPKPARPVLAFLLTDEAYGLTVKDGLGGRGGGPFLFGTGLSLYGAYVLATLAGALLGNLLPDPTGLGLDFVFPLTFLALLLPLVRSWTQALVAGVAGTAALALGQVASGGVTILLSTIVAALVGVAIDRRKELP